MLPSAQPVTSEQGGHSPRVRAAESRAQAAHPSKHGSRGPLVTSLTAHRLCSLHPLFRRGGRHATEPMSCGHQAQGSRIQTTVVAPEPTSSLGPCFLTDKTRTEHRGRTGQAARSPQPPAAQSLPQPSSQGPGAGPLPVSCPSAAWGWAATGSYKAATPPGPLCSSCRDAAGLPTLSIANSRSLPKLMSIKSVMPCSFPGTTLNSALSRHSYEFSVNTVLFLDLFYASFSKM